MISPSSAVGRTEQLREQGARERNARDLLVASLDGDDPFQRLHELEVAGERKAEAEALLYYMEHERKALLSRISSEIASSRRVESLAENKLERLARADPRYENHLQGMKEARYNAERASAEYWRIRSHLEWLEKTIAHVNAMSRLDHP